MCKLEINLLLESPYVPLWHDRKRKKELGTLSRFRHKPYSPIMRFHDFLYNKQSQPGAAFFLRSRLDRCFPEGMEKLVLFFFKDAGALVGNRDDDFIVLMKQTDGNIGTWLRILNRVGKKIVDHLFDSIDIGINMWQLLLTAYGY